MPYLLRIFPTTHDIDAAVASEMSKGSCLGTNTFIKTLALFSLLVNPCPYKSCLEIEKSMDEVSEVLFSAERDCVQGRRKAKRKGSSKD